MTITIGQNDNKLIHIHTNTLPNRHHVFIGFLLVQWPFCPIYFKWNLKAIIFIPPPPFHLAATECSCSLDSHLSKSWGTRWTAFRALIPLFCCYQGSSFRKCQICSSKINVQECDSTFDLKGFFFLLFSHWITFVFLWCIKELWMCSYRGWESRSLLTRLQVNVGI